MSLRPSYVHRIRALVSRLAELNPRASEADPDRLYRLIDWWATEADPDLPSKVVDVPWDVVNTIRDLGLLDTNGNSGDFMFLDYLVNIVPQQPKDVHVHLFRNGPGKYMADINVDERVTRVPIDANDVNSAMNEVGLFLQNRLGVSQ